jgi:PHD/YefM family antitoxin component YafN of YafNO toxin-antitoxin module
MVKAIGMQALHKALSDTVEQVAEHQELVVVTHYNRAVAVILPLPKYEEITGQIFRYVLSGPDVGPGFEPAEMPF